MNEKESKVKDIIIVVLLCIIFCLVGLKVGYYYGNQNKVNDNTASEKKNDSGKAIDNKEDKNAESNKNEEKKADNNSANTEEVITKYNVKNSVSTTIKNALISSSYDALDLTKVYNSNGSVKVPFSFEHNGKTLYVNCDYGISKESVSCEMNGSPFAPSVNVYYYNGYYFVENSLNGLSIVDNNYNVVKKISFDNYTGIARVNNDVFYGSTSECEGIRSDGTKGTVVTVHKFNTVDKSDEVIFNIDHDAGWQC